jgi:hypothetical protein
VPRAMPGREILDGRFGILHHHAAPPYWGL